jgi:DNA (cytosine-5)-methyltransferase 1
MALGRSPDIAINHDPRAISMHQANHPGTKHYISNVWDVDPLEATQGREVDLFWLSPDCTFHSKARGGRPHRDRNRARRVRGLPWLAYRWAKALGDRKPKVIVMENVEEIADWGPMGSDGKPCPLRKGFTFRRFVAMLSNIGYRVDWRLLVAADYGAPTTRKRLFLIARADGLPIVWPTPTHAKGGKGGLMPWRTAAECIDFSDPGKSIFGRARPLAVNTEKRIARGPLALRHQRSEPLHHPDQPRRRRRRARSFDQRAVAHSHRRIGRRARDRDAVPHRACERLEPAGVLGQ